MTDADASGEIHEWSPQVIANKTPTQPHGDAAAARMLACTMPLRGAKALRRAGGAGRLRVDTGREALSQFGYQINYVNRVGKTDFQSSFWEPWEYPYDTHAVSSQSALQ
jgi:hypothetical protein